MPIVRAITENSIYRAHSVLLAIREKKGTDILLLEYQTYPNNPMHVLQT